MLAVGSVVDREDRCFAAEVDRDVLRRSVTTRLLVDDPRLQRRPVIEGQRWVEVGGRDGEGIAARLAGDDYTIFCSVAGDESSA